MNVLIIEDEIPAADKLERYLKKYDEQITILEKINSVKGAVAWLATRQNETDLIFMDIQLIDGKSFEIFEHLSISKPIIFVTAFDEYAIEAFKVNSIEYLLKPITYTDLTAALDKFSTLKENFSSEGMNSTLQQLQQKTYKTRFMVKLGEHIRSLTTDKIDYFYAEGRDVYLVTHEQRKFIIDYKLEELEAILDPSSFYRVNRSFIMNIEAIRDVVIYSNSRLKISTAQSLDKEIIVSRDKVAAFKMWFNGME